MFLRRYERRSGGRRRTYWALVESVRTGRGSRQRVVAYLGELKQSEQSGWTQPGRNLSGKQRPQRSLFDPPHYDDPSEDEPVLVRLRGVRLERLRDFGDVWMALGLWRLLGLDTLLEEWTPPGREEWTPPGREEVPWPVVAAILTIARFCRPQSELHVESTWYRGTALEDLLGVPVDKVHTDRLYGGLDWLLGHKPAIEKHLKDRLGALFDLEYDLLLYDITSTYFEGQYLVGTPKAMLRRFEEYLTGKDWHEVQEGVEVKLVPGPAGDETFILARSADRREKEKAMHERFVQRLEEALRKMQSAAECGRLKEEAVANRRLGRLLGQYWRAVGAFEVKIERLSPPQGKQRLRVTWTRNRRWSDWAALSEGCYLLRTNLNETDPAILWKRYIQLTEVCFLAYVLWKTLAQWMRRSGLGDAPRTVLEELAKINSGDVVLPTQTKQGHDNGTVRLRCVTEPDEAPKTLLHRLGVTLPRRLRRIDEVVPM
jgi:hypothetical protein